jgi:hypothetical protein
MRLVWWLPLVFLALLASQTPANATINRLGDALTMSGSCDGAANRYATGEYDQAIATITGATVQAVQFGADVNATYIAELGAAAAQLYRCKFQAQYWELIMRAHTRCSMLRSSVDRTVILIRVQRETTGGASQPFVQAVLSNFHSAVRHCWTEIAIRCIDMDDRAAVRRAADVLRVARQVGLSRSDLLPLSACTETIPFCRPGEPRDECIPYLRDVAEILFGDGPPPAIGEGFGGAPPAIPTGAR